MKTQTIPEQEQTLPGPQQEMTPKPKIFCP